MAILDFTNAFEMLDFRQPLHVGQQIGAAVDSVEGEGNVVDVGGLVEQLGVLTALHWPTPRLHRLDRQSLRFDTGTITAIVGMVRAEEVVFELDSVQLVESGLVQHRLPTHEVRSGSTARMDLAEAYEKANAAFALRCQVKAMTSATKNESQEAGSWSEQTC